MVIRTQEDPPPQVPPAIRYVAPPKTSQIMAETHGTFDTPTAPGPSGDPTTYQTVADRDAESLPELYKTNAGPQTVRYFPDPFARGGLLSGLPGLPANAIKHVPFDGAWPDAQTFRILLLPSEPGLTAPAWDATRRILTVRLDPAVVTTVQIGSFVGSNPIGVVDLDAATTTAATLGDAQLEQMAVWAWMREFPGVDVDVLRSNSRLGFNWLLTPTRALTLVHAVQRPLARPLFKPAGGAPTVAVERDLGDTSAVASITMTTSAPSTAKVDVYAAWTDVVDDLSKPGTVEREVEVHMFEQKIEPTENSLDLSPRHNFGDTLHRIVRYRGVASTRFREYFPPNPSAPTTAPDPKFTTATRDDELVDVSIPSSARPPGPVVRYAVPT